MSRYPTPPGFTRITSIGDLKARQEEAAERRAKREANREYDRLYDDMVRRDRWAAALANATARRQQAEQTVAEISAQLVSLEHQAVTDHRFIRLIRPARDDLEVAREILERTKVAEAKERALYEERIAAADAEAAE